MKTSKTSKSRDQFSNRVRYNWGYHDAAQAVRRGWDCIKENFGFATYGILANITPDTLLTRHHDTNYAQGWLAGLADARSGRYTGNSEAAWTKDLASGLVTL